MKTNTYVIFNGNSIPFNEGESVAAALLRSGEESLRETRFHGKPRAIFCGIGVCFDCVVAIDGVPNQRACIIECREGMKIESRP
ncbi:MAG: hypothetical protein RL381_965 [Actinomycetota bacterium]|jgi:hypothetical protein